MAEEVECRTRKWGSSIGIVIPNDLVQRERIKPNETIRVTVKKIPLARELWDLGPLKRTEQTHKIKEELRKGWGDLW